jgi:hypothetical protein
MVSDALQGGTPKPEKRSQAAMALVLTRITGTAAKLWVLGTVNAPDEKTAIAKAIEEFKIAPQYQQRLMARRSGL